MNPHQDLLVQTLHLLSHLRFVNTIDYETVKGSIEALHYCKIDIPNDAMDQQSLDFKRF